jgi:CubicO group peptidase (beta-lactamase class C family)
MRRTAAVIVVSLLVLFGQRTSAQSLTFSLFERYLDSLRVQAGIPGLSALILQDGVIVWERGFGRADIERALEPTSFTAFQIGGLSQVMGATLFLKKCGDENFGTPNDPLSLWLPLFPERTTTVAQLLGHVAPTGGYKYDPTRFAAVTPAIEACSGMPYQQLVAEDIFSRLGLADSVPGSALGTPTVEDVRQFGTNNLTRYAATLARAAKGYRVDTRGRVTRTDPLPGRSNAATGLISTARDLAKFDAGLRYNILLQPDTQLKMWTPVGPGFPTGLGWFVQTYNGIPVVWQFGVVPDAFSSLMLKLPTRGLTLILLANSDGLNPPLQALEKTGDVNASVFARTFLRVYVP